MLYEVITIRNGSDNTIGGTLPPALIAAEGGSSGNLISGNDLDGVEVIAEAGFSASGNAILGNFIGTDITGLSNLRNARTCVAILNGAEDNSVGEPTGAAYQGGPTFSNLLAGEEIIAVAMTEPNAGSAVTSYNFV